MTSPEFTSDRLFRVWDWSVSHCRLLIRSPRSGQDPTERNIDIAFYGVFYLELPESLHGISVVAPTPEDEAYLRAKATPGMHGRLFVLESSGRRLFVGAVQMEVTENDLPPMQSSLWRP